MNRTTQGTSTNKKNRQNNVLKYLLLVFILLAVIISFAPVITTGYWDNVHLDWILFAIIASIIFYFIFSRKSTSLSSTVKNNKKISSESVSNRDAHKGLEECPFCNEQIENNSKYCPRCGKELKLICSECNRSIPASSKYCPICGQKRL